MEITTKEWLDITKHPPASNWSTYLSHVKRKPTICICENKDADQLRGNREADQRLCFRYLDSTIPSLPRYKISSPYPSPVAVQPGLCQTWAEPTLLVFWTFLMLRLICMSLDRRKTAMPMGTSKAQISLVTIKWIYQHHYYLFPRNTVFSELGSMVCLTWSESPKTEFLVTTTLPLHVED